MSDNTIKKLPPPEQKAALPPAVREEVVALLAQILVADYELFQGDSEHTVKSPPHRNRKLRVVGKEETGTHKEIAP